MQRRSFLTLIGAGSAAVTGLGPGAVAAERTYAIALVPGLVTDPFYITMRHGAEAAAQAVGAELVFQGAAEWDVALQVPVLDAVIAAKPDAILIAPTHKVRLIAPLKRASDAGIPVITVDTFIGDGAYQTGAGDADFPLSYVASDNITGGAFAARALARSIGDKGKVYVATVKPGVSVTDQREEGFRREMRNHPNIAVLDTQFNDDDADKAASQVRAVLGREPDLAGIFGADLFSAAGTAHGVRQAGLSGKVKVVTFDAPQTIVDQLKDGTFAAAIAQHPGEIGYFAVMAAFAHLTGNSVPTAIGTGFTVMTRDNIDDPKVRKFVYTI